VSKVLWEKSASGIQDLEGAVLESERSLETAVGSSAGKTVDEVPRMPWTEENEKVDLATTTTKKKKSGGSSFWWLLF
jgi:hypothetical protein